MTLGLVLALVGAAGFTLTGGTLLAKVFCLELRLLGANSALVLSSLAEGLAEGYAAALLVVCVAGAETAIGLSLLVPFYRGSAFAVE
jgi:NADH:ubiquinone oxidoreductase subunit K